VKGERQVLELKGAVPAPGLSRLTGAPLNLAVAPDELVMIDARDHDLATDFADLCLGLVPLLAGAVCFLGRDWANAGDKLTWAMRGQIGRMPGPGSWIGFLGTDVNILLAPMHHSHRPEQILREEASALARDFGLPGLPVGRPDELAQDDLLRAACVRAFIGQPRLLLLYARELEGSTDLSRAVLGALAANRYHCASIWLTCTDIAWRDRSIQVAQRLQLSPRGLLPVQGPT
jgi:phospholipid/cholesterol/gamma-HCH transport system ATP-binding protein